MGEEPDDEGRPSPRTPATGQPSPEPPATGQPLPAPLSPLDRAMDADEQRAWARRTLERLGTSKFRAGFRLSAKDLAYASEKGETTIREHAHDLLERRVGPARPARDGKQTPFRGHPVFTAQHATATCCRGCMRKWHRIPEGRPLTAHELDNLTELVIRWIRRDVARQARAEKGDTASTPRQARAEKGGGPASTSQPPDREDGQRQDGSGTPTETGSA